MLHLKGYNTPFVEKCLKQRTTRPRATNNFPTHYLSFPFISDYVDRKIKRIFRNEGINIRIYRKQKTLRQELKKPLPRKNCDMKNCLLKNKDCFQKMVVYSMECTCGARYIGSTIRTLHTRVREHHRQETSAIFRHRLHCESLFSTTILKKARDPVELRLLEAILISSESPNLNDRDEGKDVPSYICNS